MKGITIYLGSKCNLNCAYCHREADANESGVSDTLLDMVRGQSDIRIKFMGGEPTLYMEDIKKVVEAAPNAQYAIGTNGSTLKEHLEFFKKHKFLVCISYDGTDLRGYDPFQEVIDYPWVAVSCTLYHGNTDFKRIIRKFKEKEKVIGRSLSFFPHIMHATGPHNLEYSLTKTDMKEILRQYKECIGAFVFDYVNYGVVNKQYYGMFTDLKNHYYSGYIFGDSYCVNGSRRKTDSSGRLLTCLYIRDTELSTETWREEQKRIIRDKFPRCETCDVYDMCGAACIKSIRHDIECSLYRPLYSWFRELYNKHKEALDQL